MDMKQIKDLMAAMEKMGLKKIRIKEEKGFELELEGHPHYLPVSIPDQTVSVHHQMSSSSPSQKGSGEPPREKAAKPEGKYVISPMVGTFYSAPSPDDPLYVKIGDEVDENTIVCIIEAMKVMNEVKAGKKGKIAEMLVSNADPVEFGTKLFRIV